MPNTSFHDQMGNPELSGIQRFAMHAGETLGLIHGFGLRLRTLLNPVQTLVLTGH